MWIAEFDGVAGTVYRREAKLNPSTEASGELWSPDGKNILFTSDVYPECDGLPREERAMRRNSKKREKSKVKALEF